jgi:hypothetical protein
MNLQVIASPHGDIVWVSGPLPGAVHDLTAARIWGIIQDLAACGLVVLGDKGYLGEDCIRTPYRGRNKPASQKEANRTHARLRAPGERANAQLKSWRILRKLRCCPWRAGHWPRRSTSCKPAKPEDEKGSLPGPSPHPPARAGISRQCAHPTTTPGLTHPKAERNQPSKAARADNGSWYTREQGNCLEKAKKPGS